MYNIKPNTSYTVTHNNPLILMSTATNTVVLIRIDGVYNIAGQKTQDIEIRDTCKKQLLVCEEKLQAILGCRNVIRLFTPMYTPYETELTVSFDLFGVCSRGLDRLVLWDYYIVDRVIENESKRVRVDSHSLAIIPFSLKKQNIDTRYPLATYYCSQENNTTPFFDDGGKSLKLSPWFNDRDGEMSVSEVLNSILSSGDTTSTLPNAEQYHLTYYTNTEEGKLCEKFTTFKYYRSSLVNSYYEESVLIISSSKEVARLFNSKISDIKADVDKLNYILPRFFENLNAICLYEEYPEENGVRVVTYNVYKHCMGIILDSAVIARGVLRDDYFDFWAYNLANTYPVNAEGKNYRHQYLDTYFTNNNEVYIVDAFSYCIKYANEMVLYLCVIKRDFDIELITYNLAESKDDWYYKHSNCILMENNHLYFTRKPEIVINYNQYLKELIYKLTYNYTSVCQLPEESRKSYIERLVKRNADHKVTFKDARSSGSCIEGVAKFLNILKRYRDKEEYRDKFYVSDKEGYTSPDYIENTDKIDLKSIYEDSWISLQLLYSMREYDDSNILTIVDNTLFSVIGHAPPRCTGFSSRVNLPERYISSLMPFVDNNNLTKDDDILRYKKEDENYDEDDY